MEQKPQDGFLSGPPATMFAFGLAVGVAICAIASFALSAGGGTAVAKNTGRTVPEVTAPTAAAPTAAAPVGTLPEVQPDEHIRGNLKKAKVVLVEYSDFECPFCSRHHPVMQQVVDTYGDDVAWVWRHFPLSFHPQAKPAAVASECAAEQGLFWEYADELIARYQSLGTATYTAIATELGMDLDDFDTCRASGKYDALIAADQAGGQAAGATGTPATFVNGQLVSGALPFEQFQQIIDAELAR